MTTTKKQDKDNMQVDCGSCLHFCDESKKPQCRRSSPTRRAVTNGWTDGWPTVKESDWCGEWMGVDEEGGLVTFEDAAVDIATAEDDESVDQDEGGGEGDEGDEEEEGDDNGEG